MNILTDAAVLLERAVARLPLVSNELAKQAALAIVQDLLLITPVDVGTALSNWQVSLDFPSAIVIPAFVPSPRGRTINGKWQHATSIEVTRENNASTSMSLASALISSKKPGQPLFITNNLPYIRVLDSGSSDQAPAGFIDRVQIIAQSFVDSGLILG